MPTRSEKELTIGVMPREIFDQIRKGHAVTIVPGASEDKEAFLSAMPQDAIRDLQAKTGASVSEIFNDMIGLYMRAMRAHEENMQIGIINSGQINTIKIRPLAINTLKNIEPH